MNKDAKLELLWSYYNSHGIQLSRSDIESLQRIARTLQNSAVNLCNIPDYQAKHDRTEVLAWNKLVRILSGTGIGPNDIQTSGDPRGYVLKIKTKTGEIMPERFN